jgi:hypothetical protein
MAESTAGCAQEDRPSVGSTSCEGSVTERRDDARGGTAASKVSARHPHDRLKVEKHA